MQKKYKEKDEYLTCLKKMCLQANMYLPVGAYYWSAIWTLKLVWIWHYYSILLANSFKVKELYKARWLTFKLWEKCRDQLWCINKIVGGARIESWLLIFSLNSFIIQNSKNGNCQQCEIIIIRLQCSYFPRHL